MGGTFLMSNCFKMCSEFLEFFLIFHLFWQKVQQELLLAFGWKISWKFGILFFSWKHIVGTSFISPIFSLDKAMKNHLHRTFWIQISHGVNSSKLRLPMLPMWEKVQKFWLLEKSCFEVSWKTFRFQVWTVW